MKIITIVSIITETIISLANKGTTAISFESHTEPRMNKTGNPFYGKVIKISFVGGLIGYNYQNSVNNQLDRENKETNFTAQPRKWGVRDEKNPFLVHHKEDTYLSVKVQQTNRKPIYVHKETKEVIPIESLRPFLPKSKKPNTQKDLDKEVIVRDYKVRNLKKLTIGGMKMSFSF